MSERVEKGQKVIKIHKHACIWVSALMIFEFEISTPTIWAKETV
jgi:hypothetical protein